MSAIMLFLAATVAVNFDSEVRPLRPELHSSGFGPRITSCKADAIETLKTMGFKAARTHDWAHVNQAERVCDWVHMFPLQHLDAKDPKNYYFDATDHLLRRTREEAGLEVFFRLGASIEHSGDVHFNALIPEDLDKAVEVFAGTIRHYNRGWGNGHKWGIKYWEIWNESDGANMWCYNGPDATNDVKRNAAYLRLFTESLRRLKGEFPEIKVGGPACWFLDETYLRMLLDGCKAAGVRPDFISWHNYENDVDKVIGDVDRARRLCDEYGLTDCELIINEWHYIGDYGWKGMHDKSPEMRKAKWGSPCGQVGIESSCYNLALLSRFQTSALDQAYFYGCKPSGLYGYCSETGEKWKLYYGLCIFGDFLKSYGTICASQSDDRTVTTLAAKGAKGKGLLVTAYRSGAKRIEVGGFAEPSKCRVFVHDNARDRAEIPVNVRDGKIILDRIDGLSAAFWIQGE